MKHLYTTIAILLINLGCMANIQEMQKYPKLMQVLSYIESQYVDTIGRERLENQTIKIILEHLDPHSSYKTTRELYEENKKDNTTMRKGIGATFRYFDDTLTVVKVKQDGPAYKAGLRPGYRIASINKSVVSDRKMKCNEIADIMLKATDDTVQIGYFKNKSVKNMRIPLEDISPNSIESHFSPNDTTIYIRITSFKKNTSEEFNKVLALYSKKKRRCIILDLRDNPGGNLASCLDICDHFMSENMIKLTSKGANMRDTSYFCNKENGLLKHSRACILINENSASASEAIASSLQDWDRAVVIGRRSYGKGLSQQVLRLNDGSQLKLTNSKLIAPSGRCVQKYFDRNNIQEYFNETNLRKTNGENLHKDSIKTSDAPVFYTIVRHRPVRGNMGVIPDVFVAEDTTMVPEFWKSWIQNGLIDNFIYDNINANRLKYNTQFSDFNKFLNEFYVDEDVMNELYEYSVSDTTKSMKICQKSFSGIVKTNAGFKMRYFLKARFAYCIFGANEYRRVLNTYDEDYLTALELIDKPEKYYKVFNKK